MACTSAFIVYPWRGQTNDLIEDASLKGRITQIAGRLTPGGGGPTDTVAPSMPNCGRAQWNRFPVWVRASLHSKKSPFLASGSLIGSFLKALRWCSTQSAHLITLALCPSWLALWSPFIASFKVAVRAPSQQRARLGAKCSTGSGPLAAFVGAPILKQSPMHSIAYCRVVISLLINVLQISIFKLKELNVLSCFPSSVKLIHVHCSLPGHQQPHHKGISD